MFIYPIQVILSVRECLLRIFQNRNLNLEFSSSRMIFRFAAPNTRYSCLDVLPDYALVMGMPTNTLLNFYSCTVKSILTGCFTPWFSNLNAQEWRRLQKVVNTAQSIMGTYVPTIEGIYRSCCLKKASSIIRDPLEPWPHTHFTLAIGRRYRRAWKL